MSIFNKESRYYPFAILLAIAIAAFVLRGTAGCVSAPVSETAPAPTASAVASCCEQAWGMKDGPVHTPVKATGYTPENTTMEGGPRDRYGAPLRTLQDYLSGRAEYVSVAMDQDLGRVKRKICVPELNATFGKPIAFLVVDTGKAFKGKGFSRIDIANNNQANANADRLNRSGLTLVECK